MSSLGLNDDGTITVPLIAVNGSGARPPLKLREPSIEELGNMHDWAIEADEALPALTPLGEDATPEQAQVFADTLKARQKATYSGADSPHAQAMVKIVNMLSGADAVTIADLPGWASNPRALNMMLTHFQSPLHGEAAALA